jgi:peptidoglycan/LPS O-acetylase OafA/YrhL
MSTATLTQLEASATTRRPHYPGLDGLRGIAILAVFLSHYSGGHTAGNSVAHFVAGVLDAGWMGVDLFFVLSGFLITGILLDTADDPNRVLNFYARRALRIFPVFYGVLFVFLLLTPVLHLHWLPQHLLYFFYLSNMIPMLTPHAIPPGRGVDLVHFWSLAVEEQFYLVWPLVVWRVVNRKLLFRIAVGIMAAALVLRVLLVAKGVPSNIIYQLLPTRADSLICGSLLALAVRWQNGHKLALTPVFVGSGIGVLIIFWASGGTSHDSALISTLGYTLIALFFGCVVYYAQQKSGWVRRASDHSVLRFFGRYSYGLYIYHGVLLVFLVPLLGLLQAKTHSLMLGGACFVLLSFGVSLAVSMVSYHLIEHPILRYKRNFA